MHRAIHRDTAIISRLFIRPSSMAASGRTSFTMTIRSTPIAAATSELVKA
jgi:hypothetical protein